MSLYNYSVLLGGLLFASIAFAGQKTNAQRDFYLKCMAAGHSRASCTCIYHRLERQYSPKLMLKLGSLSLQSPEVPRDFVKTMKRTMQQCQS
ncbi:MULTISPECIES: hypothetical protein [Acinetobacter]|jgi:hypothetical protein|uniref:hypothetical protein n=1 Tax=Acinetobacter TaxID=469 RepID=UPI0002CE1FD3|nr:MULTISPECIES: hypothetical protein [Acinetobacter]AQZ80910.1 hypothetical protein BUM88_04410 [Acinetobacter calcoaceticus]ENV94108.1 hypothetical protein F937_03512 [Acinetobacter calcoaceticus ANC 3680]KQQ75972.1 hypothetical protein ASF86_00300 [Acinetobacter sp. Leaf130]MDS7932004.1 hypothetical protein [Acinetobacter sp. V102_4]MDS7933761.1 hypothetical protein [Acinetobacter sp. V91_4B]